MINIYQITNSLNGDCYVGKTIKTLQKRFSQHKTSSRAGSELHLHNAMRHYGFENFKIDLLDIVEDGSLFEQTYIKSLKPKYNMTRGGDGGSTISGRIAITNGAVHRFIKQTDSIPKGFRKGISDELCAKNTNTSRERKVRSPHTSETKKKISMSRSNSLK